MIKRSSCKYLKLISNGFRKTTITYTPIITRDYKNTIIKDYDRFPKVSRERIIIVLEDLIYG